MKPNTATQSVQPSIKPTIDYSLINTSRLVLPCGIKLQMVIAAWRGKTVDDFVALGMVK